LIVKVAKNATNDMEICQLLSVAFMRHNLDPSLKTYVDLKGKFSSEEFSRTINEWEATQPFGVSCFKKQANPSLADTQTVAKTSFAKKPGSCFYCGKPGHFSKDCRSRIAREKSQQTLAQPVIITETPEPVSNTRQTKKEVMCFNCRQKGHKSPQCPLRQPHIKRIKIPSDKVVQLKLNELFGAVGKHRLPITCDAGADVSVVPEECVNPEELTRQTCEITSFNKTKSVGNLCNIDIRVHGKIFHRRAVTQPGDTLGWTACLNLSI